jgi:hypothetical protein
MEMCSTIPACIEHCSARELNHAIIWRGSLVFTYRDVKMIRSTFITLVSTVIGTMAVATTPFEGVYLPVNADPTKWDCQNISFEGGAVAIKGNWLIDIENTCELTNPSRVIGMKAFLYDGHCAIEGDEYSERIILMEQANGRIFVIRDGSVNMWKPCR